MLHVAHGQIPFNITHNLGQKGNATPWRSFCGTLINPTSRQSKSWSAFPHHVDEDLSTRPRCQRTGFNFKHIYMQANPSMTREKGAKARAATAMSALSAEAEPFIPSQFRHEMDIYSAPRPFQHRQLPIHTFRNRARPEARPSVPSYVPLNISPLGTLPDIRHISSSATHPKSREPASQIPDKKIDTVKQVATPKRPAPSEAYLAQASNPPTRLVKPQHLLIILDLNGTLLARKTRSRSSSYNPRASLSDFLTYCLKHHSLMIWSSATPRTVKQLCSQIMRPEERGALVAEWGRDKLGLSSRQYREKVQVYKCLDRVWGYQAIQETCPGYREGNRWGQHNTLLVEDSAEKARSEPWNLVQVPELARVGEVNREEGEGVLTQVAGWINEARLWSDVSAFSASAGRRFALGKGWHWNWETAQVGDEGRRVVDVLKTEEPSRVSEDSNEEGGVKLLMT